MMTSNIIRKINLVIKHEDTVWNIDFDCKKYSKYKLKKYYESKNIKYIGTKIANHSLEYDSIFVGNILELGKSQCQSWIYFWCGEIDNESHKLSSYLLEFYDYLKNFRKVYLNFDWTLILKYEDKSNDKYILTEFIPPTLIKDYRLEKIHQYGYTEIENKNNMERAFKIIYERLEDNIDEIKICNNLID